MELLGLAALVIGITILAHHVLPKIVIPAWERRRRAAGAPLPRPRSSTHRWTFIPVAMALLLSSRFLLVDDWVAQLAAAFASVGIAHYVALAADRLRGRRVGR